MSTSVSSSVVPSPYLNFDGSCEAAFKFYVECFGGEIECVMRYGTSPMAHGVPEHWHDKVLHSSLKVGEVRLMGADSFPGRYEAPKGISVALGLDTIEEAERVFAALAAGGKVNMPIQETFWAKRFGMLDDQFGIPWLINCAKTEYSE